MKLLKLLLGILIVLSISSCTEDDIIPNDSYYVKYHYIVSTRYDVYDKHSTNYCSAKIKYIDSNYFERIITHNNNYRYEYDIICGPFNYNDNIELTIFDKYNVHGVLCEIFVSKNGGPFVLRYYGSNDINSYNIDF